jgi:hypothetical protein
LVLVGSTLASAAGGGAPSPLSSWLSGAQAGTPSVPKKKKKRRKTRKAQAPTTKAPKAKAVRRIRVDSSSADLSNELESLLTPSTGPVMGN